MIMKGNMMWKVGWLLTVCLSVLLMGTTALAQETLSGKIDGFVFHDSDKDGAYDPANGDELLSNVQIIVQADNTGQIYTTDTDVRGGYELTGLPLDELYTVQVNVSSLPSDKLPLATAGADSIGAIAWVVFLSSEPADPTTVLLPSEANVSFGFGPASPTTVAVSEIDATAASLLSLVVIFATLSVATLSLRNELRI